MTTLKIFIGAFLLIGFIYFILSRAITTKNYKRKSLYIFISGLILTLAFVGGIIFDIVSDKPKYPNGKMDLAYFGFLIVAVCYMITFTLIYFIKGVKRNQRFKYGFGYKEVKTKVKPTVKDKKGYVYFIFKYNNNYLLKTEKEDNIDIYKSLCVKFSHNDFFHDDVVRHEIENLKINTDSYKLSGVATKKGMKDDIYYCYTLNLNEIPESLSEYKEYSSTDILSINLSPLDKQIIFNSILQSDFNIELN